jgi:hypothetical protein
MLLLFRTVHRQRVVSAQLSENGTAIALNALLTDYGEDHG